MAQRVRQSALLAAVVSLEPLALSSQPPESAQDSAQVSCSILARFAYHQHELRATHLADI